VNKESVNVNKYFAGPSMDYSLAENIYFSIFWQHFEGKINLEKTE